jgi:organic hydroperoxide reductase OsmC/OhrA
MPFPHRYDVSLQRFAPSRAKIAAPPRVTLVGGPPPEFRGDAEDWSPEHLLCSALGLCLFTTFEALAARAGIELYDWRCDVAGVLDKTAQGLRFTSFTTTVDLTVAAVDTARARDVMDRAKQSCIVSNALDVPVTVDARIWEHDQRAHG